MTKVEATVTTGALDKDDLLDIHICAVVTVNVTGIVSTPARENDNWIYGRPIMHKKGKWSYG